jgi:sugar-phosphatase
MRADPDTATRPILGAAPWTLQCATVLLDLDGTLVDSGEAILRGWRRWADDVGAPTDILADIVHGRSAADTITRLLPHLRQEQVKDHVAQVLRIQEEDPVPGLPMAGAAALVRRLEPGRWAIVTGCSTGMAVARLAAGGLPGPDVLITDEQVRQGKPHPEGYLLALRRLGIDPGDAVAVEDAPAGVEAAKAAGIRTIAVTSTHPLETLSAADVVVDNLDRIQVSTTGDRYTVSVESGAMS